MFAPMTRTTTALLLAAALLGCDAASDRAEPDGAASDGAPIDSAARTDSTVPIAARLTSDDPYIEPWLARVDTSLFTSWGACPFECCVYREWLAEASVVVRVAPSERAAVVVTIPGGERFEADTGFVRVRSPQLVIVTAPVEAYYEPVGPGSGRPDTLEVGDTLLVVHHVGEGHWLLTDGENRFSAEQFWPTDDYTPYQGARGSAIGEHEAEWWARVRTAAGAEGWIDAYASDLGNVDACGVPV
jgi:hypothetical protein